jgi:hypothetical protein
MMDSVRMEKDTDSPQFYSGLLVEFFHELKGERKQLLLDECREVLALNLARGVSSGKHPDITNRLDMEAEMLGALTHELITGEVQPPPN